jgi:hypothetical protein
VVDAAMAFELQPAKATPTAAMLAATIQRRENAAMAFSSSLSSGSAVQLSMSSIVWPP